MQGPDPPVAKTRDYAETDFEEVVALWHRSKRAAYPFLPLEQARTLEEDRAFFRANVVPRCRLRVYDEGGAVCAFLAMRGSYLDRLYVDPGHQRRGIGRILMDEAFRASPSGIELHTHQENRAARAFYEGLGFRAFAFGVSPPPESAPDVEYRWRPGGRGPIDLRPPGR